MELCSYRHSHKAMDTAFTLTIQAGAADADLAAAAAYACFERIDAIELLISKFNATSDVALIRSLKPGDAGTVSQETIDVLRVAAQVAAATNGAFDPALGTGFGRLTIDAAHHRVAVGPDAQGEATPLELDFGGIGKGFALDACREILVSEQFDLTNWLFDAGTSTILASGGPWPLGVGGKYKARTKLPVRVMLSSGALSGSGFEIQGAHVIDPRTGKKAAQWEQSWAKAPTATVADALTTAALSLDAKGLTAACRDLNATVIVARKQTGLLARLRDPLVQFGPCY